MQDAATSLGIRGAALYTSMVLLFVNGKPDYTHTCTNYGFITYTQVRMTMYMYMYM